VIYDADCGQCSSFKRAIDFLDVHGRIDFKSLIDADKGGFLDKIPPPLKHKSFHLILPEGETLSGAKAVPRLMTALPAGRVTSWFVTSTCGGTATVSFIYSLFSRLHGSGSCGFKSNNTYAAMKEGGSLRHNVKDGRLSKADRFTHARREFTER